MRKTIGLILMGFLLSGCYASSLTYVGTGAGIAQGKSIQSLATHTASYAIQQQTGWLRVGVHRLHNGRPPISLLPPRLIKSISPREIQSVAPAWNHIP